MEREPQIDPVTGQPLVGWGRRAAARLIDTTLLAGAGVSLVAITASEGAEGPTPGAFVALAIGPFAYEWLMLGTRGQTLGRLWVGIAVRRATDGERLYYPRALGRILAWNLLGLLLVPLAISVLWPLRDPRRQTLHDKLAGTIVVRVPRP